MEEQRVQRVAGKAVIEAEGGILVLQPSQIDLNRKWHLPGGLRDDIAEPILATTAREVAEETGIDLQNVPGKVVTIGEWPAVDQGQKVKILGVFFHFKLEKRPNIVLSEEHDQGMWINRSNYHEIETSPEMVEIVEMLFQ